MTKTSIDFIDAFPERDNENKRVFKEVKMSVCILGATKKSVSLKQYFFSVKSLDDNEDTARVSVGFRLYDEAMVGQKGWLVKIDKESSRPWVSPYWIVPLNVTPAVVTKLVTDKNEHE